MKIWITGCNGMLAKVIKTKLTEKDIEFIGTGRELNIGCARAVQEFAKKHKFTHIINCAAYTNVDGAESDSSAAYDANAFGPGNLAMAAVINRTGFIHFSTDYVFGNDTNLCFEDTPTNPLSVYACSKNNGEILSSSVMVGVPDVSWHIIRTSWLFGHGGKNFVSTMLSLMGQKEILRVVNDQYGRPTFANDLADAALLLSGILGDTPAESGFYHFANRVDNWDKAGFISWYRFANEILALAKKMGRKLATKEIQPITTAEFQQPARRPAHSVLSTSLYEKVTNRTPRDISEALFDYLYGNVT